MRVAKNAEYIEKIDKSTGQIKNGKIVKNL